MKHFSEESSNDFRNSTPRRRSRTTKIVHRGARVNAASHFSAETPTDFAISQARKSPRTINIVVSEPPFLDQTSLQ